MADVEKIDQFTLYPPEGERTTWAIADGGGWLPVYGADRDACLLMIGFMLHPDCGWDRIDAMGEGSATKGLTVADVIAGLQS